MNKSAATCRLTTPKNHGEVFLWPPLARITRDGYDNRSTFDSSESTILAKPLSHWRSATRTELFHLAQQYSRRFNLPTPPALGDRLLVVTGHQCELFHCGIIVKYMLLDHLARATDGVALNLAADHDLPKHTNLRIPYTANDRLTQCELPLRSLAPHVPMEHQPPSTSDDLARFSERLLALPLTGRLRERATHIVELLQRICQSVTNLAQVYMRLNHRLADELGLAWIDLPVSIMCQSESFATFVADAILQAERFGECYNVALADYRTEHRIRNAAQPLPNLTAGELPFWLFRPNSPRKPLYVRSEADELTLNDGECDVACIKRAELTGAVLLQALDAASLELRPRALTLTVFARLFLADMFVHGIGGAHYDKVADHLIRSYYEIDPPAFSCVSATMQLPLGQYVGLDQAQEKLRRLAQLERDRRYNPQRYVEGDELCAARWAAIAESDRLRREAAAKPMRRAAFEKIARLNGRIAEGMGQLQPGIQQQREWIYREMAAGQVAYDREYFFGLFGVEELEELQRVMQK